MIIVFKDRAAFDVFRGEVVATPQIEGGSGPVIIGEPVEGADGRCMISHDFGEDTCDWIEAWTQGDNPPVQIFQDLMAVDPAWISKTE